MEIRKIKPEERVLSSLLSTVVFLGTESPDYKEHLQNPLDHSEGYDRIWGGFDDNGRLCASLHSHAYKVRFDGHVVGMGGIGGVGTLPECRKGGYVRRIFEKCLPEMKEEGHVFSFLYPFSFVFYRKFGYEMCYAPNYVKIPMAMFKDYPMPDGITMYRPGDDVSGFASVYDTFSRDMNLAFHRDEAAWQNILKKDPYITRHYAYLHKDKDGMPDGYILFKVDSEHGDEGNTLQVKELAWANKPGLYALFGFINGLDSQFETLSWKAPTGFDVFALFPENYEISVKRPASGMNRIVDLPKALQLLKPPMHSGKVTVRVQDQFLPFNTGTYQMEWESGVLTVKPSAQPADLETNIETMTQLVTGYLSLNEAQYKQSVTVNGNEANLNQLFTHKNLYIMEHF